MGTRASNQQALERIAGVVEERGIDCDFERASNFVYTESTAHVQELEREAEAARAAGIEAELTTETDLPYPVAAAVRVDEQAQFHPWKYVAALARDGRRRRRPRLRADARDERARRRSVRRRDDRRIHPRRSRDRRDAAALPRPRPLLREGPPAEVVRGRGAGRDDAPRGMYISVEKPTRSIRSTPADEAAAPDRRRRGTQARRRAEHRRALRAARAFMRERFGVDGGRVPLVDARLRARSTACRTSAGCGTATIASSSRPATRSGV